LNLFLLGIGFGLAATTSIRFSHLRASGLETKSSSSLLGDESVDSLYDLAWVFLLVGIDAIFVVIDVAPFVRLAGWRGITSEAKNSPNPESSSLERSVLPSGIDAIFVVLAVAPFVRLAGWRGITSEAKNSSNPESSSLERSVVPALPRSSSSVAVVDASSTQLPRSPVVSSSMLIVSLLRGCKDRLTSCRLRDLLFCALLSEVPPHPE
jgi:hypothetical protein